jgi:transposase
MARKYVAEFKENIIARMLPPRSESVSSISKETGISVDTLYTWRIQYRNNKRVPANTVSEAPRNHDSEEKLLAIIETASLSETELKRQRGTSLPIDLIICKYPISQFR